MHRLDVVAGWSTSHHLFSKVTLTQRIHIIHNLTLYSVDAAVGSCLEDVKDSVNALTLSIECTRMGQLSHFVVVMVTAAGCLVYELCGQVLHNCEKIVAENILNIHFRSTATLRIVSSDHRSLPIRP